MKSRIYFTLIVVFVLHTMGWSQTYTIYYKGFFESVDGNLIDLAKKWEKESIDKTFEPNRVLSYSDGVSLFGELGESDIIEDSENSNEYKSSSTKAVGESTYKNQKENLMMVVFGGMFAFIGQEDPIIKSTLAKHDWQLTNQYRNIASYPCRLATTTNDKGDKVLAWYTDKIAINEGPSKYWGLPGLILQLQVGERFMYVATSIKRKDKKSSIPKPVGNIMNQKEFDIYVKEILKPRTVTTPDGRVITISGSNN